MQGRKVQTNQERSERTRAALIATARRLFIEKGYAETSTPEIVSAAQITRGALYHHFVDKRALFRAVIEAEARDIAQGIVEMTSDVGSPREALRQGALAYLQSMTVAGRSRLMLIEGPAVLGLSEINDIDSRQVARTLDEGLAAALPTEPPVAIAALAMLLSAAFDRTALAIAEGAEASTMTSAMLSLLDNAVGP